MKKVILLSSTLLAAPFMFGETGEASAQCTTSTDCATLGYTSSSNTGNCIKCPVGTTWYCPPKNNTCISSCTDYTLTYSQAQTQCGTGNFQACRNNCTGELVYKCTTTSGCTSNCSGYTLSRTQAQSQCTTGEACLDNCTGNVLYKCVSSGSSGGSSGDSCTCPSGYGTYRYSACSGTTTSSCGSTCYEMAVEHPIEWKICTNVYCNSGKNTLYGTCVYQSRSSYKDSWQTTKTVNDDNVGSAMTYDCNKLPGKFIIDLKSETTCGPY